MTSSNDRVAASKPVISWQVMPSTLGPVLIAASDRGVCCVAFGEEGDDVRARFPDHECRAAGEENATLFAHIIAAIEAPGGDHSHIALDPKGTAFQRRCWQALRDIPAGETRSYGEQAAALGNPKASRAVGSANAANPVAVLIPCHRVVPAGGGLGGYAYGSGIKAELLRREGVFV